MGGHFWFYFVPYQQDVNQALQSLRRREFRAGRYNPAVRFPNFPVESSDTLSPGVQHDSIEEALEASNADGTRSVLDMQTVGIEPGYGVVVPLSKEQLLRCLGTQQPTREMIEANMEFAEDIERGQGVNTVAYENGQPAELLFAGYSYD
jgi:hypothetical protein